MATVVVQFRCSADERDALVVRAEAENTTLSNYIRDMLFKTPVEVASTGKSVAEPNGFRMPEIFVAQEKLEKITDFSDESIRQVVNSRLMHGWDDCDGCQRAYSAEVVYREREERLRTERAVK